MLEFVVDDRVQWQCCYWLSHPAAGITLKNSIEFTKTIVGQASSLPLFGSTKFSVQQIRQARCLPHFINGRLASCGRAA
jgi:hypothetical protein